MMLIIVQIIMTTVMTKVMTVFDQTSQWRSSVFKYIFGYDFNAIFKLKTLDMFITCISHNLLQRSDNKNCSLIKSKLTSSKRVSSRGEVLCAKENELEKNQANKI